MTGADKVSTFCPYPDCEGRIDLPSDLPPGEYYCLCQAIRVRLSWDTYLEGGRRARLSFVKNEPS